MDFSDKSVLVTGASGGIGRVIAQKFAETNASVAVHFYHNEQRAQDTLTSLKGEGHILVQADISDPESAKRMIERVVDGLGKIDILVNNAGIFTHHAIAEISYKSWREIWQQTIATNLLGPAYLTFGAVQHMLRQGGGKIINVSSRGAFRGEPNAPAYGASKAGLNAMSQSLAKALAAQNIFVYAVAPGFVKTDMVRDLLEGESGAEIRKQSPLGRVARPEEIARTVLFLAGEETDFLTGCIIDVNGASYLRT